ncbi:hypothetical protein CUN61_12450 [Pseudomonas arsenicoxydans]|uniref:DUF1534 domain-containing protein n=1 Tax=Pseudomonas arsenicoxydans TaxID=702115 RepID=A0A4V0YJT4_9PSED|nr:hypothetical protein CUN61_12450 [Pseudomonas arsenicoxydans]
MGALRPLLGRGASRAAFPRRAWERSHGGANLRQSPPCATRRLNCVPDDRRIALHRQTAEKPRSRHARRPPPAAAAVA